MTVGIALIALVGTLAGVVIGSFFQLRNWRHQNYRTTRQEQKKAALETVQELAKLLDRRLYRQRLYLWALRRRSDVNRLDEARRAYREVLFEWNDNLGRFKASLGALFEDYQYLALEDIHIEFQKIGGYLEGYDRTSAVLQSLGKMENGLSRLGRTSYEWIRGLLRDISDDHLRGYMDPLFVDHSNWENLSSSFLLKRLFGFAEKP